MASSSPGASRTDRPRTYRPFFANRQAGRTRSIPGYSDVSPVRSSARVDPPAGTARSSSASPTASRAVPKRRTRTDPRARPPDLPAGRTPRAGRARSDPTDRTSPSGGFYPSRSEFMERASCLQVARSSSRTWRVRALSVAGVGRDLGYSTWNASNSREERARPRGTIRYRVLRMAGRAVEVRVRPGEVFRIELDELRLPDRTARGPGGDVGQEEGRRRQSGQFPNAEFPLPGVIVAPVVGAPGEGPDGRSLKGLAEAEAQGDGGHERRTDVLP